MSDKVKSAATDIETGFRNDPDGVELDHTSKNSITSTYKKFHELMEGPPTLLFGTWKDSPHYEGGELTQEPWGQDGETTRKRQEVYGLGWGAIYDAHCRVDMLSQVGGRLADGTKAAGADLDPIWSGKGAEAAQERIRKISKASGDFQESCSALAANLMGLWRATTQAVRDFCDLKDEGAISTFLNTYGGEELPAPMQGAWGAASPETWKLAMEYINSLTREEVAESRIIPGGHGLAVIPGDPPEWIKIFNDFCAWYNGAIKTYREGVSTMHAAVDDALTTFKTEAGMDDYDPFAEFAPKDDGGSKNRGGDKGRGDGGGAGGDTGGAGDTGGTGGGQRGGTGGGGNGTTPPPGGGGSGGDTTAGAPGGTPSPGRSEPAEEPPRAEEGQNPVTGEDLETDPDTGEAYPIDPETGEAVKDEPDTVNVRKGDKQLSITEPSSAGAMTVDMDDGKGAAKQYKLDFGNGEEGRRGGGEGGGGAASGFGPQGSSAADGRDGGKGAQADEDVHTPDEDGKIRIEDGDVEIVAEQPLGPDGATVVTVDDGDGEAETYVLGDDEAIGEFNETLAEDESELVRDREALESKGDDASDEEWSELEEREEEFRERGGTLEGDDESASDESSSEDDDGDDDVSSAAESEADSGDESAAFSDSSISGGDADASSAMGESPEAAGAGVGATGSSSDAPGAGGVGGGGGGAPGGGAGTQPAPGAMSGAGTPGSSGGGGAAMGGDTSAGGSGSSGGGGGMGRGGMGMMPMGAGMAGAGAGGGVGDEDRTNSAYQATTSLFEPEVEEGPFGVARISGELDDEQ